METLPTLDTRDFPCQYPDKENLKASLVRLGQLGQPTERTTWRTTGEQRGGEEKTTEGETLFIIMI